jgi:glycosyltransferase involved in cell wall biosynthesis
VRICYIYDAVAPWETGGVQKRVWELARRLAADHDVHWYGLHYWDGPPVIDREGVTLHGVGDPPDLYVDGRRSISEALSFTANLVPALSGERFDVIDCQEFPYFPAFVGKLASLVSGSLLLTWHEVWSDYWYEYLGRKGALGKLVERATALVPDAHVAVSERTRRDVAELGVSDPRLVPNGIDLAEIEATEAADGDVDVDLLYVGRFIEQKGPEVVVDAVDELHERGHDVSCTMVGEGPEEDRIDDRITTKGLADAIDRPGRLEAYSSVLGLMKAADAFVLPSRREGFGITVLEALACGTPVVTTDHPRNAARDLVDDGTTGAVRNRTGVDVADGVLAARECDPADCRARAADYDWDRIAGRTEAVYEEVARS